MNCKSQVTEKNNESLFQEAEEVEDEVASVVQSVSFVHSLTVCSRSNGSAKVP